MIRELRESYLHRGGDEALLGDTIPVHFKHIVNAFPDNEAIVCLSQQRRLTYQQLDTAIDELARGLFFDKCQAGTA